MYFRVCPDCGAHLDPDERCECKDEMKEIVPMQSKVPQRKSPALHFASRCQGGKIAKVCGHG